MTPTTRIITNNGIINSDCLSEEFSHRRVYITDDITDSTAASLCCQINHLASLSNDDITLWIMSPGGSVSAGIAILDTIRSCACEFRTIVMGTAASMAAVIASSGTKGKRFIGSNSGMMIHQALGGFSGQTADVLRAAQHISSVNHNLYKLLSDNTGVSEEKIEEDCDRDYYLNAEEAINYGLVDHIFTGFD